MDGFLEQKAEEELEKGEEKFCPDCGRILPPDATYCPICGVLAEVRRTSPRTMKARLLSVGRTLVFVAGFIALISGVVNFITAWVVSSAGGFDTDPITSQSYAMMALMFLVIAILSIVGSAFGWTAALTRWRKEKSRWTAAQITFLAFTGFVNLTVGAMYWGIVEFGYLFYWATGFLTIIFSILGLILTALV